MINPTNAKHLVKEDQDRLNKELEICSRKMIDKRSLVWCIESGSALEDMPQIVNAIENNTINYYDVDVYGRNALHLALKKPVLEPIAVALINKDARLLLQTDKASRLPAYIAKGEAQEVALKLVSLAESLWNNQEKKRLSIQIDELTHEALDAFIYDKKLNDENPLGEIYRSPYFYVSEAESYSKKRPVYVIENARLEIIADDVINHEYYSCNDYYDLVHIEHKDNTHSVLNRNGKPLKDACRVENLTILGTKEKGPFRYHIVKSGGVPVFHKVYPWKRYMRKLSQLAAIAASAAFFVEGVKYIQKEQEESRRMDQQPATLIKMDGAVALFDANGDKKPDYVGKPLNAAGQGFLSEHVGQTKKIGSWKSAQGVEFIKYQRPQNENQ